jgi:hypothetical protein
MTGARIAEMGIPNFLPRIVSNVAKITGVGYQAWLL